MIFERLTIRDFGVYRGEHTVDLYVSSSTKPVILFGGLNGAGKTTLLDAILVCLYGPLAKTSNRGSKGYRTYLRECVNRNCPSNAASVSLTFLGHVEGQVARFHARRQWRCGSQTVETFSVSIDGHDDELLAENWLDYIETIIPASVAPLFFFDGEKIEALADIENAKSVFRSSLQSLLGMDLLERLDADLATLERRTRIALQDEHDAVEIRRLQEALAALDQEVGQMRGEQAALRAKLDKAEKHLAKSWSKYRRKGGEFYTRRTELHAEKGRLLRELADAREELCRLATEEAPLLLVGELLAAVVAQSERERESQEAASIAKVLAERDDRLLGMLVGRVPADVCDRLVEDLSRDREGYLATARRERYLCMSRSASDQARSLAMGLPETGRRYGKTHHRCRECEEALAGLEAKVQSIPTPDIIEPILNECARWEKETANLRSALERLDGDTGRARNRRTQLELSLAARVRDGVQAELDTDDSMRVVSHSECVRDLLGALRTKVLARHVSGIEDMILGCFQELARKTDMVQRIEIDPVEFSLGLVGADGMPLPPARLSAGERQLLAVAILWGLARVSDVQLPVVIDTPLGRLDGEHRTRLVQTYFPRAAEQVLVLSTDEEIAGSHERELMPWVARSYLIEYDEREKTSRINEGYFDGKEASSRAG